MRVLLDEDLPHRLRLLIPDHDVITVSYAGWKGLKNGVLLRTAESAAFEVFVTGDQNLPEQQTMNGRKIGVVVLSHQKMVELRPHLKAINDAIDRSAPGTVQFVECRELLAESSGNDTR
jgi:hypothetical protein